jgi:adenylate kinase family enzyme
VGSRVSSHERRIAIIGNAGGGKSTLARELARRYGIERHSLDDVQWLPDWKPAPLDVVARHHRAWLSRPSWVIDGWGAWDLIEERFACADTIIVIDLPLVQHYWRSLRRLLQARRGASREWPPEGCDPRGITLELMRVIWRVHSQWRPRLLRLLESPALAPRVVRLRSQRAIDRYREQVLR